MSAASDTAFTTELVATDCVAGSLPVCASERPWWCLIGVGPLIGMALMMFASMASTASVMTRQRDPENVSRLCRFICCRLYSFED